LLLNHALAYWLVLRLEDDGFFGDCFPPSAGGSFAFRFSFAPSATCALREGDGPRADGFSFGSIVEDFLLTNEADGRIGLVDPLPRTGTTASLR
jgi:hypothetical protein